MMSGDPWCDGAAACLVLAVIALLFAGTGAVSAGLVGLLLILGLIAGVLIGVVAVAVGPRPRVDTTGGWQSPDRAPPRSAEAVLRERYARGELTRERYLTMLEDLLKDRYVRGELELDEYEARVDRLLSEPGPGAARRTTEP